MPREMNLVTMLPKINPMLAIRVEGIMHGLIDGRNHLDMNVKGYTGGLWTMRQNPKGTLVPVLPEGNYTIINPMNYSEVKVDPVTAGYILYVIAVEVAYHMAKTEKDQDALAQVFDDLKEYRWEDAMLDQNACSRVWD